MVDVGLCMENRNERHFRTESLVGKGIDHEADRL
jgi:hypothetical protein